MYAVLCYQQGNLELLLDKKYSDWLKSQSYVKSCDGQLDADSHDKERIAAVIEKIVQCGEPTISNEGGQSHTVQNKSQF